MEGQSSPTEAALTLTQLKSQNSAESSKEMPNLPPLIVEFRNYFGELSPFMEPHAYHIGLNQSLAEMCELFYNYELSSQILEKAQAKLSVQVCQDVLFNLLLPAFTTDFPENLVRECFQQIHLHYLLDAALSSSGHEKVREAVSSWCMFHEPSSDPFGTPGRDGSTPRSGDGSRVNGESYNWSSHGSPPGLGFGSLGREYRSGNYGASNDTASGSYPLNPHNHHTSSAANHNNNSNSSNNHNNNNIPYQKSVSSTANRLGSGYIEDSRKENRKKAEVPKNASTSRVVAGQNSSNYRSAHPTAPLPPPLPPHAASMPHASLDRTPSRGGSNNGMGKNFSSEEDYERNPRYQNRGSYGAEEHPRGGGIPPHYHHSTPPANQHSTTSNSSHYTTDNARRGGFRGSGRGNYNTSSSFSSSPQPYDSGSFVYNKGSSTDAGKSRGASNGDAHRGGSSSRSAVEAFASGGTGNLSSNSSMGYGFKRAGDGGVPEITGNRSGSRYSSEPHVGPAPYQSPPPFPVENSPSSRATGEVSQSQPPSHRHLLSSTSSSSSSGADPSALYSMYSFHHQNSSARTPEGYNELQKKETSTPHHQHQHSFQRSNEVPQRPATRGAGRRLPLPAFQKRSSVETDVPSPPSTTSSSASMPSASPSSGPLGGARHYQPSTRPFPSLDRSSSTPYAPPPGSVHTNKSPSSENISPPSLPTPGGPSVAYTREGKTGGASAPSSSDAGFRASASLRVSSRQASNSPYVGMTTPGEEGRAYSTPGKLSVEEERQAVTPLPLYRGKGRTNRDGNSSTGPTIEIPSGGEVRSAGHTTPYSSFPSLQSGSDAETPLSSVPTAGVNAPFKPGNEKGPLSTQSSGVPSSSIQQTLPVHYRHHVFDAPMMGKPLMQRGAGGDSPSSATPSHVPFRAEPSGKSVPTSLFSAPTSPPPSPNTVKQLPSNATAGVAPFSPRPLHHHHHHSFPRPSQNGVSQGTSSSSMNSVSHVEDMAGTGSHSSLGNSSPSLVMPHHAHHIHHIHHLSPPTHAQHAGTLLSASTAPQSSASFLPPQFHHNIFSLPSSCGNTRAKMPPYLAPDHKAAATPPLESSEPFCPLPSYGSAKTFAPPSKSGWQGQSLPPASVSYSSSAPQNRREEVGGYALTSSSSSSPAVFSATPGIPLSPPSAALAPPPLSFYSRPSSRSASQTGIAGNGTTNENPRPSSVHAAPFTAEMEAAVTSNAVGDVGIPPARHHSDPYSTIYARSSTASYAEVHLLASANESGSVDETGSEARADPKTSTGGANGSRAAQEESSRSQENMENVAKDTFEARPTALLPRFQHQHSSPAQHEFSGSSGATGGTAMFSRVGVRGGRGGRGTNAGYFRNGPGRGVAPHASSISPSSLLVHSLSSANSEDSYLLQAPPMQTEKPEDSASSFHSEEKKASTAENHGDEEPRSYSTTLSNPPRCNEEEEKQEREISVNNTGRGSRRGTSRGHYSRGRGRGGFGYKNYRDHDESTQIHCKFHSQGHCKFGSSCRNSHQAED